MVLHADLVYMIYLVTVRVGALLLMSPVLGAARVPIVARVIIVITLSVALASGLRYELHVGQLSASDVVLASVNEVINGSVMALGLFASFAAARLAGQMADLQMGLSLGAVFDPTNRSVNSVMASAMNLMAVVGFFALDGHLLLVRALAFSLQSVPPGAMISLSVHAVVGQFGAMVSLGLMLVAPTFACLLLVEVALASLSRAVPQMNVFVIGMPVKVMTGIGVMALTLPAMAPSLRRVFESTLTYWAKVLN